MSIDWQTIDCAILEWAQYKLDDLTEDRFQWSDQNLAQPAYPYLTFKRDSVVKTSAKDEVRTSTDLTQPQGEEIALETIGVREFTLTVQAFVDDDNGATDPNCDATALLTTLQLALSQLKIQEIFCLAGLAVVEELPIINLSREINGEFKSQAAMDVRFRTSFTCIERTGYIDTVEVSSVPCNPGGGDVEGVDLTVTAPIAP